MVAVKDGVMVQVSVMVGVQVSVPVIVRVGLAVRVPEGVIVKTAAVVTVTVHVGVLADAAGEAVIVIAAVAVKEAGTESMGPLRLEQPEIRMTAMKTASSLVLKFSFFPPRVFYPTQIRHPKRKESCAEKAAENTGAGARIETR
jgi:hypothetical protein